jgi:hypothetical protein
MNSADFEIFYNWNNSLKTNDKIQFRTIQAKIKPMLEKEGFSKSEVEEILLADGFKANLIKEALNFNENSTTEEKVIKVAGIPKSYSDLSSSIERVLKTNGPSKFVALITSGTNPLVKISSKEKDTLQKIADTAYDNPVHLATLHAFLKPSIVSELAENVCRARKIASKCSITNSNNMSKISYNGKIVEASTLPIYSNSEKFVSSNYDKFGFPDEYVILAYENNSPYAKISKDLG